MPIRATYPLRRHASRHSAAVTTTSTTLVAMPHGVQAKESRPVIALPLVGECSSQSCLLFQFSHYSSCQAAPRFDCALWQAQNRFGHQGQGHAPDQ